MFALALRKCKNSKDTGHEPNKEGLYHIIIIQYLVCVWGGGGDCPYNKKKIL